MTRRNWSIFSFWTDSTETASRCPVAATASSARAPCCASPPCNHKKRNKKLSRPIGTREFSRDSTQFRSRASLGVAHSIADNGGAVWLASGFRRMFADRACSLGVISLAQLLRLLVLVFATEHCSTDRVGGIGVEPMTSAMSTLRSNQSELTARLRFTLYHKFCCWQMQILTG